MTAIDKYSQPGACPYCGHVDPLKALEELGERLAPSHVGHDDAPRDPISGKPDSKYERRPELDKRIGRGDDFAGDAWVRYTAVGHSPTEAEPDGYAVILDDKASAPKGFWFVGCYTTKEAAASVAMKGKQGGMVVPIYFAPSAPSSTGRDLEALLPLFWHINDHLTVTPDQAVAYTGSTNDVDELRDALHRVDPHFKRGVKP